MVEPVPVSANVEPSEDVIFRDLEGESVLLDLKTGIYFGLNPVGTRIWQLLEDGKNQQQIIATLLNEYDTSQDQCEADVAQLLGTLKEKGLVQVST